MNLQRPQTRAGLCYY